MKVSSKGLILFTVIGIVLGAGLASGISPIFSNVVHTKITTPAWTGTVTLSPVATSYNTGDSITLTATLNPLPTQYQSQQHVAFYYSATAIPANPDVSTLSPVGSASTNTVTTVAGVATLTFTSQAPMADVYFVAIVVPT